MIDVEKGSCSCTSFMPEYEHLIIKRLLLDQLRSTVRFRTIRPDIPNKSPDEPTFPGSFSPSAIVLDVGLPEKVTKRHEGAEIKKYDFVWMTLKSSYLFFPAFFSGPSPHPCFIVISPYQL
ncbi:hypothetical protein [Paraflavitalea sp. CAU 1676]|uniref:hypothetical protein n=1 Tax=Paraflavitalea sp. CAU 1676 TaxID=3032598 RepID=UPI0023D9BD1D|nr:hypothetical protein [Paraflavitalea sp. CAU 1676]MDF2189611.1 hypothetical protein [Paraflavitalea sp. CAU 1676]